MLTFEAFRSSGRTSVKIRPGLCWLGMVVLWFVAVVHPTSVRGDDPAQEMAATANRLVSLLNEAQSVKCRLPLDGPARETWNFVPDKFIVPDGKRAGLPLTEMSSQQRLLTHALLTTALSNTGYRKTVSIMALEQVLHELENSNPIRNSDLYYLTIFGTPSNSDDWAWRFEGHHLSLSFTVREGREISVTPMFLGTNPAEIRQGPLNGWRVLGAEEDLARTFVQSLSPEQQVKAIAKVEVPADVLSGNRAEIASDFLAEEKGILFDELLPAQQQKLLAIVTQYSDNFRADWIEQTAERRPILDGKGLKFLWIGSLEVGQPHYYRIQSPAYLFEYDNTQNDANHIHAVWRDFEGDFGRDLLRTHYRQHHAGSTEATKKD
jgi:hypothetical protein